MTPTSIHTDEAQKNTLHDMDNHDVVTAKIHLATNYTCNSQMAWFKNACFFLLWSHTDVPVIFFLLVSAILPVM